MQYIPAVSHHTEKHTRRHEWVRSFPKRQDRGPNDLAVWGLGTDEAERLSFLLKDTSKGGTIVVQTIRTINHGSSWFLQSGALIFDCISLVHDIDSIIVHMKM